MPIPFNDSGVLPPYIGPDPAQPTLLSPYLFSTSQFVIRFGTTGERLNLLTGFLQYRSALRSEGFLDGYQWVDGSFVEDVERIRGVPPKDIDVVTFAFKPQCLVTPQDFIALQQRHPEFFDSELSKARYFCDAYLFDIGKHPSLNMQDACYWYGLFSHQRVSHMWKGMIQIPLVSDDEVAAQQLQTLMGNGHAAQT